MSTQEDINKKNKELNFYTALLALFSVFLLSQSNWLWSRLYNQLHSASSIFFTLGAIIFLLLCFFSILKIILDKKNTIKIIDQCIIILLVYIGFVHLRHMGLVNSPSTNLHKITVLIIAAFAALLSLKISTGTRKRLHLAYIAGGFIFIIFPVILANINGSKVYWPTSSVASSTILPKQNTVVLLLDELSSNAAGPILASLKAEGLHIESNDIEPAGRNTLNVIPAIWLRKNFDQATPCGPNQVCSGTTVLDFAKVQASSGDIDVVGFYHRYCSIKGLRTCTFEPLPIKTTGTDLFCSFPGIRELDFTICDLTITERTSAFALRGNMQQALFAAPFWQKGGILFAHLLVPHPLMGKPSNKLSGEYNENIENGAELVKLVAQKAKLVFNDDFKIVIFSDHPLRPDMWCANKGYIELGCKPDESQISTQVPLIIATPTVTQQPTHSVTNNQFVFDLLF